VTVRFTCKSGRVALGNDFRSATGIDTRRRDDDLFFEINDHAGKMDYIKWFAEQGYCTGHVYLHAWFIPTEDGLEVRHSDHEDCDEDEWERIEKIAVHDYSAELWWFAIIDAEDLPEGGTDSFDREPGFFDLEPGEYEFTSYPKNANGNLAGTLRRIEGA
jgi:hypothetical protein